MNKTFSSKNPDYNACVGDNGWVNLSNYYHGYDEAVKLMLKSTFEYKTTLDIIVYPIIYSARHRIELFLKDQIIKLCLIKKIFSSDYNHKVLKVHELSLLWEDLKKLTEIEPRYNYLTNKIDEYVKDFSDIDDTGEVFRYPYSCDDVKHLTNMHCIDLNTFGKRYLELDELLNELEGTTDLLIEEYSQKSVVQNLSRKDIENIAIELPNMETWSLPEFDKIRNKIKADYSISSKTLSKVIDFIRIHREFALLIGKEVPLKSLNSKQLTDFFDIYDEFIQGEFKEIDKFIDIIQQKIGKPAIENLSQLYEIGFYNLYSEEFDNGLNKKQEESIHLLIRFYLLGNGIVKKMIVKGLRTTGQKTLLSSIGESC